MSAGNGREGGGAAQIWFINRGVVVVRPREPFIEWVNGMEPEGPIHSLEELRAEPTAYLIPDFESRTEADQWIRENCSVLFSLELDAWWTDPAVWPSDRSWPVFEEWFDIEYIEIAWDLIDEPLSSEPPPPIR